MAIGYARCSTADQNPDWQLDALTRRRIPFVLRAFPEPVHDNGVIIDTK